MTYERSTIRRLTISIVSCCLSVRKLTRTRRGGQKPNSQPPRDAGLPDAEVLVPMNLRAKETKDQPALHLKLVALPAIVDSHIGGNCFPNSVPNRTRRTPQT